MEGTGSSARQLEFHQVRGNPADNRNQLRIGSCSLIWTGTFRSYGRAQLVLGEIGLKSCHEDATKEFWTSGQRKQLLGRWSDELKELNVAIAQHALLGGDATLADWGTKLYDPGNLSEDETKLLKGNQILAANAARYWLWHEVPTKKEDKPSPIALPDVGGQAIYSFSYHACDPEFMTLATRKAQSFFQTTDSVTYQLNDGNVVEQDADKPKGPCPTTNTPASTNNSQQDKVAARIAAELAVPRARIHRRKPALAKQQALEKQAAPETNFASRTICA